MSSPVSQYLSTSLQSELLARWSEPHRRYHTVDHLCAVLDALGALERLGVDFDREAVEGAAWFHDAIYVIGADDNEEKSAQLALDTLDASDLASEVARLVRITADHRVDPADRNAAALCDADLAVLAGNADEYRDYADQVRDEYRSVPANLYAAGRARILESLLAADTLYSTAYGRTHWEQRARSNIAAEIQTLRGTAS